MLSQGLALSSGFEDLQAWDMLKMFFGILPSEACDGFQKVGLLCISRLIDLKRISRPILCEKSRPVTAILPDLIHLPMRFICVLLYT